MLRSSQACRQLIGLLQGGVSSLASPIQAQAGRCSPLAGVLQRRGFFGSSKEPADGEAVRNAEKMLELMASSPHMQQMMMASMPPAMRNPETIKMLLNSPDMKQKMVQMIAKQRLTIPAHVLDRMTAGHMEQTFERAAKMGVDPQQLFAKLMSHPLLLAKLQQPHIMSVFMDLSTNPQNAYKYKDDEATMEVIREIRAVIGDAGQPVSSASEPSTAQAQAQVLPSGAATAEDQSGAAGGPAATAASAQQAQAPPQVLEMGDGTAAASPQQAETPPQVMEMGSGAAAAAPQQPAAPVPPPPGSAPASASSTPSTGTEPPLPPGVPPGLLPGLGSGPGATNIMTMMMSDPELMKRLQNPKVQAALMEISKSPWKTIKYIFNKDVMQVFTALNNMMRGKDPWTGKKLSEEQPGQPDSK